MSTEEIERDEENEEQEAAEDAPTPAPEELTPDEAATQEGSHEIAEKLTKENERHIKAVSKILDTDMNEKLCPTCAGFGFAEPGEAQAATDGLPADFVHPENYVTCDACNGYGEILSGSKSPAHAVVTCTKCAGLGYRIETQQPQEQATVHTFPTAESAPQNGVYIPGRGFIPYGATEPLPGSA